MKFPPTLPTFAFILHTFSSVFFLCNNRQLECSHHVPWTPKAKTNNWMDAGQRQVWKSYWWKVSTDSGKKFKQTITKSYWCNQSAWNYSAKFIL